MTTLAEKPEISVASKAPKPQPVWTTVAIYVAVTHVIGLAALIFCRPSRYTLLMTFLIYFAGALGITMGYHRLWSHRSYTASPGLRWTLAACGTLAFQGSIKWWVGRHRLHHRFTDTDDDPYNATRGFWYSHMGWLFENPHYEKLAGIDMSDLKRDPAVAFQHKFYIPLTLILGFVMPTLIASLWGDALGGLMYGGFVIRLILWHATFCINSLAHSFGSQDYTTEVTARGNFWIALITVGEGHHNFHHEFPKDYRNGIAKSDYDPTKWCIKLAYWAGLAFDLYRTPLEDMQKALIVTAEKKIASAKQALYWGPADTALPLWTVEEVRQKVHTEGAKLLILDGYVLDVASYMESHPGGKNILKGYLGRDASVAFNGGVNVHSQAAHTKTEVLRVARLQPEQQQQQQQQ